MKKRKKKSCMDYARDKTRPGWVPVKESALKDVPFQTVTVWMRKGLLDYRHIEVINGRESNGKRGYRFINTEIVTEEFVKRIRARMQARKEHRTQSHRVKEKEWLRRYRAAVRLPKNIPDRLKEVGT